MDRLKPIVSRHWLFALAGVMWSAVGLMLIWRAFNWLAAMPPNWAIGVGLVGIGLALSAYYFMFTKTVTKNINRLYGLPDRVCLFAFNSPKGYGIIIFMIALGVALRHSSLPRWLLAVVYAGMGGALLLASFHFYGHARPRTASVASDQRENIR